MTRDVRFGASAALAVAAGVLSMPRPAAAQADVVAPTQVAPLIDWIEAPAPISAAHGIVAPGNTCAQAGQILTTPFVAAFTLSGFTPDGPPGSCNGAMAVVMLNDAWFRLTAPIDGTLSVEATFSNAPGIVVVHRGAGCGTLVEAGCASGDPMQNPHAVEVAMEANEELWIQVGRRGSMGGPMNGMVDLVVLALPPNDECAGAIEILEGQPVFADTRNASAAPGDPPFSCRDEGVALGVGTLWYSFIAESEGVGLSTCNTAGSTTDSDSLLAVYSGECGSLTEIACNDTGGCWPSSGAASLAVTGLTPGATYLVQLAVKTEASARVYQLDLVHALPCPSGAFVEPEACGQDTNGGCNSPGRPTTPIAMDQSVCGQLYTEPASPNAILRDLDWYDFEVLTPTRLSLCVETQPEVRFFILDRSCDFENPQIIGIETSTASQTACISVVVDPGAYTFVVTLDGLIGVPNPMVTPCGAPNQYLASLRTAPMCSGDANGDGTVDFNDINAVITNWLADYSPGSGPGDADSGGNVNFGDINAVIVNWLSSCP